ncbi:hypothetical protein O1B10_001519 [Vibrio cholerae]|nr:hypothetical protein [Vibrio cholerae]EKF9126959.1 hypothetical protein [Vibrio cholerae]EKF9996884.1 hypothetical protein [Vibrio cholerae]EKG0024168.1 hypothetical protein [Vibrio cholerae]
MKCWICPQDAISREHIIKKSDIVRFYGRAPYKGIRGLAHVKAGKITSIQGPDSKKIKYNPSLCHHCNTTLTQPFDRAYDVFVDYVFRNEQEIIRKRYIDFADVYGDDFDAQQCDLFRYFAKSFGCRLADIQISVPSDVVNILKVRPFETALSINFCINTDVLLLPKSVRDGFIGKGDLVASLDKKHPNEVNGYYWDENISWLFLHYWYNTEVDGDKGSKWLADNRHIYLGEIAPLPEGERARLKGE